jgi:hypothetical protein
MERVGMERRRRRQQRWERVAPRERFDQRPGERRCEPLRHGVVPGRERGPGELWILATARRSFTSAGGDPQARSVASFALTQIIAYPTPTVTPGRARAKARATFTFVSGESGSTFSCKLDDRKRRSCISPKTYKKLEPGKHVFRVRARDRAGNRDATPAVRRFKIAM